MAHHRKPKHPEDPEDPKPPQDPGESDQDGEGDGEVHETEGRDHAVHMEILARRMRGGPGPAIGVGPDATREAYARALEQWKNLPGSVVRPPTDVTLPPDEEPSGPADPGSPTSQPGDDRKDDKEPQL
jgi:hypothetical protein